MQVQLNITGVSELCPFKAKNVTYDYRITVNIKAHYSCA